MTEPNTIHEATLYALREDLRSAADRAVSAANRCRRLAGDNRSAAAKAELLRDAEFYSGRHAGLLSALNMIYALIDGGA